MLLFYLASLNSPEDKKTFEYYYLTYQRQMFAMANSVLHNERDAEDAVHNAFLGILKHVDVLQNTDEEKGKWYCLKAAKNAALNIVRKNRANPQVVAMEVLSFVPDERALEELIEKTEYGEVLAAVNQLGDIYRDVLYLHYVMEMPVKKIADVLNRKTATVKQQLVRGKKMLSDILSQEVKIGYGE